MNQFRDYGVPITLNQPDDFLKIRETLTRIGIETTNPNKCGDKGKSLIQSCHILHIKGKYAIVHFKELFKMEGKDQFVRDGKVKETYVSEDDLARRNYIAFLLEAWGLLNVTYPERINDNRMPMTKVKIIPFREKHSWNLISKYSLDKPRK